MQTEMCGSLLQREVFLQHPLLAELACSQLVKQKCWQSPTSSVTWPGVCEGSFEAETI